MFTINIEDGREAPSMASIYIYLYTHKYIYTHIYINSPGLVDLFAFLLAT